MIYFVLAQDTGRVKIGYAEDSEKRVIDLQVGSPELLVLVHEEKGGFKEEKEWHERFGAFRLQGEWFGPNKELYERIGLPWETTPGFIIDKNAVIATRSLISSQRELHLVKKKMTQRRANYEGAKKQWRGNIRRARHELEALKGEIERRNTQLANMQGQLGRLQAECAGSAQGNGHPLWIMPVRLSHRTDDGAMFTRVQTQPDAINGEGFWLTFGAGAVGDQGEIVDLVLRRKEEIRCI